MALRAAVIGAGHIGRIHLQAYTSIDGVEAAAVCDVDASRAEAAASNFGCRAFSSVAEMLREARLDLVSVCTAGEENGSHHFEPVMHCLEAGVPVLCEKPLSNRASEAREMVRFATEKGVAFGCDLNHRFTPLASRARTWIEDRTLGDILLSNVTLWIDNPNDRSPWFHLKALHPHSLDLFRYFCGPVTKVHAFFNRAPKAGTPDGKRVCWSSVQMNLLFRSGAVGHLTGSYDQNSLLDLERCEVMGTEGRFVIENAYQRLTLYPRHSQELTVVPNPLFIGLKTFDDTIGRRIARFVEQVASKTPPSEIEASGADGLAVQEIIEAAIESWEGGRVVDVENG